MIEVKQGQMSTVAITVFGIIAAIIIAKPEILGQFGVPTQYISSIVLIVTVVWNYLKPRAADIPEPEEIA